MSVGCNGIPLVKSGRHTSSDIDAHKEVAVPYTSLEHVIRVITGHDPIASHHIVNMIAVLPGVGSSLAGSDTELCSRHEVGPFVNLRQSTECFGKDEGTDGVSVTVRTVGI